MLLTSCLWCWSRSVKNRREQPEGSGAQKGAVGLERMEQGGWRQLMTVTSCFFVYGGSLQGIVINDYVILEVLFWNDRSTVILK